MYGPFTTGYGHAKADLAALILLNRELTTKAMFVVKNHINPDNALIQLQRTEHTLLTDLDLIGVLTKLGLQVEIGKLMTIGIWVIVPYDRMAEMTRLLAYRVTDKRAQNTIDGLRASLLTLPRLTVIRCAADIISEEKVYIDAHCQVPEDDVKLLNFIKDVSSFFHYVKFTMIPNSTRQFSLRMPFGSAAPFQHMLTQFGSQTFTPEANANLDSAFGIMGARIKYSTLVKALEDLVGLRVVYLVETPGNAPDEPNVRVFIRVGTNAVITATKMLEAIKLLPGCTFRAQEDRWELLLTHAMQTTFIEAITLTINGTQAIASLKCKSLLREAVLGMPGVESNLIQTTSCGGDYDVVFSTTMPTLNEQIITLAIARQPSLLSREAVKRIIKQEPHQVGFTAKLRDLGSAAEAIHYATKVKMKFPEALPKPVPIETKPPILETAVAEPPAISIPFAKPPVSPVIEAPIVEKTPEVEEPKVEKKPAVKGSLSGLAKAIDMIPMAKVTHGHLDGEWHAVFDISVSRDSVRPVMQMLLQSMPITRILPIYADAPEPFTISVTTDRESKIVLTVPIEMLEQLASALRGNCAPTQPPAVPIGSIPDIK
jgi:hypothetical protein